MDTGKADPEFKKQDFMVLATIRENRKAIEGMTTSRRIPAVRFL